MLFWRYASVVIILLSINDVCGLHFRKLGRNTRINTKLRSRNEHDFGSLYSKNVMKVGSMLLSGNLIFAQPIKSFGMDTPWYCSDNVVTLNDKSGREVVVVGTAHISEDSVDLVRKAIRDVKPDTVMIELDKKRLGKADNSKGSLKDFGFTEPAPRNAIQPSQPLRISDDALSASSAGGGALSDNVGSIATIQKSSYEKVSPLRQITSYLQEAAQKVAGVVLGNNFVLATTKRSK